MKYKIRQLLLNVLTDDMQVRRVTPEVEISDVPEHGDYTTNVAMQLTKILKKPPMAIGQEIKEQLEKNGNTKKEGIEKIEVVQPGFINFYLTNYSIIQSLTNPKKEYKKQKSTIMVEFAHPNTHKAFHIGHLRNIITGECIVRLLEATGNKVIRANYQGDVGLHIAKCLYGMLQMPNDKCQMLNIKPIGEKIDALAKAYTSGNKAYEGDEKAKEKINTINKQIYDKDPAIYPLYRETRAWSLEYFDAIYKRIGSHFDRFYFESETYALGKKLVLENTEKGIFEKSDGAIIFPGKKYKLHNRVFITSDGNATYEGKDIGLAQLQFAEYHPDTIIHCVSSEQIDYFRVLFEAIAQVFPDTKGKESHLVYGWVRLKEGKMSSRTGNVVLGEWLLEKVKVEIKKIIKEGNRNYGQNELDDIAEKACIAATKYAFLKVSIPQEIAFDIRESINTNGDSGPYLLYTYARCKSVLQKSDTGSVIARTLPAGGDESIFTMNHKDSVSRRDVGIAMTMNPEEHAVARLLLFFPEIVESAAGNFSPNILCSYLFLLSQVFNLFYNKHQIVGNSLRLLLTKKTAETLKKGLYLLGIETAERM